MRRWKRFCLVPVAAIAVMASRPSAEEARKTEGEKARTAPKAGAPSPGKRRADPAALPKIDLPPPPEGVTDLGLGEVFKRPGKRGLEYTEKAKGLDGKRVRILGYMVEQDRRHPGLFLLTSRKLKLHEEEYGLAEDLPPATVHVLMPEVDAKKPVRFTPGILLLTGKLTLGPREEVDGRISTSRLELEEPPSRTGEKRAAGAPATEPKDGRAEGPAGSSTPAPAHPVSQKEGGKE